jgi:hypothetical protein
MKYFILFIVLISFVLTAACSTSDPKEDNSKEFNLTSISNPNALKDSNGNIFLKPKEHYQFIATNFNVKNSPEAYGYDYRLAVTDGYTYSHRVIQNTTMSENHKVVKENLTVIFEIPLDAYPATLIIQRNETNKEEISLSEYSYLPS